MFRSTQSMLKVKVVDNTFYRYHFVKTRNIAFWNWNEETTSLSSTHFICAGSGKKEEIILTSTYLKFFFCIYNIYKGVQHLDVKEVASYDKSRPSKLTHWVYFVLKIIGKTILKTTLEVKLFNSPGYITEA
jgi:hypothetical protein